MGLRPLGEKWQRKIAVATGQDVAWANGNGGQVFEFRTSGPIGEHRHGWFDRRAYMGLPPEQRAQPVEPGEVWGWDEDEDTVHWWSCSETVTSDCPSEGAAGGAVPG